MDSFFSLCQIFAWQCQEGGREEEEAPPSFVCREEEEEKLGVRNISPSQLGMTFLLLRGGGGPPPPPSKFLASGEKNM